MSMYFDIIKSFNESTSLIHINQQIRILKEITPAEIMIYEQLKCIKNKSLAEIYDVIRADGKIYVVQEYVKGETIYEYIERVGVLSVAFVKTIISDICDALDVLHRNNIVHRDVSANNIIINEAGVKLIDFGISRIVKSDKTRDTQILGTQGYAAPEQFGFGQTTPRSDIYSVGVLMNYMLTAKMPHEQLAKGELAPIIQKCMQIDEIKRYQSVTQLKNAVHKDFLHSVPGFRTNRVYKKIIASLYYSVILLLFIFVTLITCTSAFELFAYIWFTVFAFYIPVFIFMNYKNWTDIFFSDFSKIGKFAVRIGFTLLSLIISLIFIAIIIAQTPI